MRSQGEGPDSDWRCTSERQFVGNVTSNSQVTVEFEPDFTPGGCTNVLGGERATGALSSDSISLSIPYHATCEMVRGGSAPSLNLDIAATVTLTRW